MLYVLTGFSCNGKTTFIERVKKENTAVCLPEFGTYIDPRQYLIKTGNLLLAADAILRITLAQWDTAVTFAREINKPVLLDRCFLDVIALAEVISGVKISVDREIPDFVRFLYLDPLPLQILQRCLATPHRKAFIPDQAAYFRMEKMFRSTYQKLVPKEQLLFVPSPAKDDKPIRSIIFGSKLSITEKNRQGQFCP